MRRIGVASYPKLSVSFTSAFTLNGDVCKHKHHDDVYILLPSLTDVVLFLIFMSVTFTSVLASAVPFMH